MYIIKTTFAFLHLQRQGLFNPTRQKRENTLKALSIIVLWLILILYVFTLENRRREKVKR